MLYEKSKVHQSKNNREENEENKQAFSAKCFLDKQRLEKQVSKSRVLIWIYKETGKVREIYHFAALQLLFFNEI